MNRMQNVFYICNNCLLPTLYGMATQTILKKILQNYASQMHTTNITKYILKIYKQTQQQAI